MRATFSLFPWDVEGDPAAPRFLADRGVSRVALAATYHATRAATPRHPSHRIVQIPTSASYLDAPSPLPRAQFSFERSRDRLEVAGIAADAWVVLTHVDGALPHVPRVIDAFGTPLDHALCLRAPATLDYVDSVLASVIAAGCDGLVIEAADWMGLGHASLHDKVVGSDIDSESLSWCLCPVCCEHADVDPADVRAALLGGRVPDAAGRIRASRREAASRLRDRVRRIAAAAGIGRVLFHPSADLTASTAGMLADAWAGPDAAAQRLSVGAASGAYVTLLAPEAPTEARLATDWAQLAEAGADDLLIYHAGIAATSRIDAATAALKGIP